jgi:hypothetical protein
VPDDLPVLVDGTIDLAPRAGDLHVGLIDEPPRPDGVATWSCRVDQRRCEALHPPVQGDVIDVAAALGEELLEVSVRQAKSEIPTHRQHDHLGREPEAHER